MNPTVEAAWIAASTGGLGIISTALVAIVTSLNSRRANAETIKAATDNTIRSLDAAREARIWDRRAAAYVEAVNEVDARRTRRMALTSRGDPGSIGSHPIEEMRKAEEPEIIRIRASLRPFASAEVWAAYQKADEANAAFWVSLFKLASAHFSHNAGYQGVLDAMYDARAAAGDADEAFYEVVNGELAW